jgi:starch synthase
MLGGTAKRGTNVHVVADLGNAVKILIAAAECSPLARTGGLGEAVQGLASALVRLGVDVTVAMPRYRHLADVGVPVDEPTEARLIDNQGVRVLAVEDAEAFDREGIYGPTPGSVYEDEWWRWGRFATRVAELADGFDILHVHDGQPAPAVLLTDTPSVVTVHNSAYPLLGPLKEAAALLGVDAIHRRLGGSLEWYGHANYLKAGIAGADRVTTVSPSFALQLTQDAEVSSGLSEVIRWLDHPVIGILNGIDVARWTPASDPVLPSPFTYGRPAGRKAAKEALLTRAGLDDGFLLGNVGRMTEQKGLGLLDPDLDQLVEEGCRFVLVGNGDLDTTVDGWVKRHPRAVWHAVYDEDLARLVFAGSDAYLMPSRFEPCGLGQMYSMRYGAIPIARLTGGLADTVIDLDETPGESTGFGFRLFDARELVKTIRRARRIHDRHHAEWRAMQRRGMKADWSWDRAAGRYLEVYEDVLD